MGLIMKTEKRRIIPQWRSTEIAATTGELSVYSQSLHRRNFTSDFLMSQKQAFVNNRNLSYAGDLLSSAYVLGLEEEFIDVAKFIIETDNDENSSLVSLSKKILKIEIQNNISADNVDNNIQEQIKLYGNIRKYKHYLKNEPKNPIAWIELGKLHTQFGNIVKAKQCVDAALFLDKNNRFIVRSASRFYHHYNSEDDVALNIIKKSDFLKTDPWLLSAEIAYSSILERRSTVVKDAVDFIKNKRKNNLEITELASALGTLEYFNGKMKDAKKYFNESLLNPNANSLAQISWMSNELQDFNFDISNYKLPYNFEAKALDEFEKKNYKVSFDNIQKWINYEPYSTRPIKLGSYILSIFLKDNERSIQLLKKGLAVNPNDIMVNNNLVYYLVRGNRLDEAIKIFKSKLKKHLVGTDIVSQLTLIATAGLLLYCEGNNEEGKKFYLKSIELAKKSKNEYLVALATVNYLKEEVKYISNKSEISYHINYLDRYNKDYNSADILILYNELMIDYDKLM